MIPTWSYSPGVQSSVGRISAVFLEGGTFGGGLPAFPGRSQATALIMQQVGGAPSLSLAGPIHRKVGSLPDGCAVPVGSQAWATEVLAF